MVLQNTDQGSVYSKLFSTFAYKTFMYFVKTRCPYWTISSGHRDDTFVWFHGTCNVNGGGNPQENLKLVLLLETRLNTLFSP